MLRLREGAPLDYGFCRDVVTLYHPVFGEAFACRRVVFRGAYMDLRETAGTDAVETKSERRCFLLLPCGGERPRWSPPGEAAPLEDEDWFRLEPGDRVLLGEGPQIGTREEWRRFVPAQVPGLAAVREVAVKRWQGKECHVEAQTEWYKHW